MFQLRRYTDHHINQFRKFQIRKIKRDLCSSVEGGCAAVCACCPPEHTAVCGKRLAGPSTNTQFSTTETHVMAAAASEGRAGRAEQLAEAVFCAAIESGNYSGNVWVWAGLRALGCFSLPDWDAVDVRLPFLSVFFRVWRSREHGPGLVWSGD
ncbi:hypothetical protein, no similarity [Maudiozyma saulgeensis]|uniref:Uncharacterized protein n=1 Tax=Maudiozyma saulgeensis TaxID=1789683 RepID=A0A1X7RA56_9SACH|nr:hypothetical protein, no similarity [Kazachstania saulgeensis]